MLTTVTERRSHERMPLSRVCKVYHRPSRRYLAGSTIDVSPGGIAMRLDRRGRVRVGDDIDVAIAWESAGLVRAESMIPGKVVRTVLTPDGAAAVAVRFEGLEEIAKAA